MFRSARLVCAGLLFVLSAPASSQVHLVRKADGKAMIFNQIGSGWRVNGRAPTDAYLIARRDQPSPFDDLIKEHAVKEGVDERIIKCVMLIESNFNPLAVSRKGARGLMQLMPGTAARYGVRNSHDPRENVRGGVRYLADLLGMFSGNSALALAAYNAGENAVLKYGGIPPYAETQEYVRRAMVILDGKSSTPVLGGGFKGMTPVLSAGARQSRAVPTGPPVKLRRTADGSVLIANQAPEPKMSPVLGHVMSPGQTAAR
ncbi:MAG: lytic transglycosylase domain-containing protein [Acidobacteria bacterium]|nr:lytic transglycosylase domain-containing protein [Acidobacteriota bacterium]MCG3191203.1 Membrane-bound lytic murein transglycosylase F [Thermoanaerobaculia bacterium]MCK6682982.1 lytic transglycosylase domain-containing protein [Thermoanaerobaculia bacterium]